MAKRITGVVFYEGPSEIDGSPIVAIATFKSANDKTGNLVQTWILRSDIHPQEAVSTGADESICGNCPLRGRIIETPEGTVNKGRACYVLLHTAPSQVYRTFKEGGYPRLSRKHAKRLAGRGLRYGSYGDPAAVPVRRWNTLQRLCTGRAEPGYSHQWQDERFGKWRKRLMASTHTEEENRAAWADGWRTFRTIKDVSELMPEEIICPASKEGGYKSTCEKCGLCNGRKGRKDRRKNIAIVAHGRGGKPQMIERIAEERKNLFALPMA